MKLYYSPGACSLSPHIALLEAGLPYDLVKVDVRAKKLENGDDYLTVNPKGQVPALGLDSGEVVTEGPVIVQIIADKVADKHLAPARDSAERYKLLEWLNFITTELHKNFSPLFNPAIPDEVKAFFKDRIMGKFKYADSQLAGRDYLKVNPKGQVPALGLDSGEIVTEGPVIVQIIADQASAKNLAPARDSAERYKLLEWLNFITTELHKNFSPLFNPAIPDDVKAFFKDRIMGKFRYADGQLAGRDYLMGKQFTVADGYLYTMLRWADGHKFDLAGLKNLMAFKARVDARPKVQEALTKEGLMKAA